MVTLAGTIRGITRSHLLSSGGLLYGQCISAVGWVGGTVPSDCGSRIVELPTSDVSNSGIVVGAGLAGARPIYIIRYQGFMWYNGCNLVNYAGISKVMWGRSCPIFIRSIGMEGGIGPVASGMLHSLAIKSPGIAVAAPITSLEWVNVWNYFMSNDCPVYCSENRLSFSSSSSLESLIKYPVDVTIFAISSTRYTAYAAAKELLEVHGIRCNIIGIVWLKPLVISFVESLRQSKFGIVLDCDHTLCGMAESVAYKLSGLTGKLVYGYGLRDAVSGFSELVDNRSMGVSELVSKIRSGMDDKLHIAEQGSTGIITSMH